MWSNIILSETNGEDFEESGRKNPPSRYKHCGCLVPTSQNSSNYDLYVYGGRSGTFPLKDFWKLDLKVGRWQELKPQEGQNDWPPHLQEHSMVHHNGNIYIFGGEISFSYGEDLPPLWIFNVATASWRRWGMNIEERFKNKVRSPDLSRQTKTPLGRRGHSAVVWNGYMLIYGGYRDLKGSLGDLWAFHFDSESWHLFSSPELSKKNSRPWYLFSSALSSSSAALPPPRHSHTAILYNQQLYIYGGMQDLIELGDLWRFDLKQRRWTNIKTKYGPGPLHGHIAIVGLESLLIMCGERGGKAVDEFWRFEFISETWERIVVNGCRPCPRVWAWGAVLPMVVKRVEGQASPQLSTTGTDDDSKYWWDYDESLLPNDDEKAAQPNAPQEKRRSSLFSDFTRFAYNNGDYQALSESNSVCLSEEEASPRPATSSSKYSNGLDYKCQKDQISALKVIDELEPQLPPPSISLIDLGEPSEDLQSPATTTPQQSSSSGAVSSPDESSDSSDPQNDHSSPPTAAVGTRPMSGGSINTRRSQEGVFPSLTSSKSATGLAMTQRKGQGAGQGVKKSSSVRFADMHVPSTTSSSCLMRECTSDYSSMEHGINVGTSTKGNGCGGGGYENPNYHGSGSSQLFNGNGPPTFKVVEAYELEPMSPAGVIVDNSHSNNHGVKESVPEEERKYCYQVTTPNYMLLIGGSESHSSQVVSKRQPLTIWRLRVTQDLFSIGTAETLPPSRRPNGHLSQFNNPNNNSSVGGGTNRIMQMNGNTTTGF